MIKERELLGDCLDRSLTLPIDLTRQSSPNPKLSLSNIETDFPNFLVIHILLRRFSTIPQERSLLLSLSLKEWREVSVKTKGMNGIEHKLVCDRLDWTVFPYYCRERRKDLLLTQPKESMSKIPVTFEREVIIMK